MTNMMLPTYALVFCQWEPYADELFYLKSSPLIEATDNRINRLLE